MTSIVSGIYKFTMFTLTLKTLDGGNYEFSVEDKITVSEFKDKIETRLNIPRAQQRLIFQGRVLQDEAVLLDCGVREKVVHLVPRPPPSETPTESTESNQVPNLSTGTTWTGVNMQQVIHDITNGIFSGLGGFTVPPRGSYTVPPIAQSDALRKRKETFDSLLQSAQQLISQLEPSSSDSTLTPQADVSPANVESPTNMETNTTTGPVSGCSPMMVDSAATHSEWTASNELNGRSLCFLSDMLARYRRLWHSAEPHFTRWENMINQTQQFQAQTSSATTKSNGEHANVEKSSMGAAHSESAACPDNVTRNPWDSNYFSKVSQLLHLNSHLLHLISDFTIRQPPSQEGSSSNMATAEATNVTTAASTAPTSVHPVVGAQPAQDSKTGLELFVPECFPQQIPERLDTEILNGQVYPSERPTANAQRDTHSLESHERRRSQSAAPPNRRQNVSAAEVSTGDHRSTQQTRPPLRPTGATIIHRVDIPVISTSIINLPFPIRSSTASTTSSDAPAVSQPVTTPATASRSTGAPAFTFTRRTHYIPVANPGLRIFPDGYLTCISHHFPHPSDLIRPDSMATPQDTGARVTATAVSTPSTTGINQSTNSTANFTEGLSSFISAATNAATSAALGGRIEINPFDLFVTSRPASNTTQPPTTSAVGGAVNQEPVTHVSWSAFEEVLPMSSFFTVPPHILFPGIQRTPDLPQALDIPRWADDATDPSDRMLMDDAQIFHVLLRGLIETIWVQLTLAILAKPSLSAGMPITSSAFTSPTRSYHPLVPTGFLSDILMWVRRLMQSNQPNTSVPASLNRMRVALRHFTIHGTHLLRTQGLIDALADMLFEGHLSDEGLEAGTTESNLVAWAMQEATSERIVDVRGSLSRLFRNVMNNQLELWKTSPTDVGFGNTLLQTLTESFLDFLSLSVLLANRLASSLGLEPPAGESDVFRHDTFDFSRVSTRLSQYVESLTGSTAGVPFFQLFLNGISHCVDQFGRMQDDNLRRRINRLRDTCLVYRTVTRPPRMEVDGQPEVSVGDVEMDDLPFVDASSELPASAEHHSSVKRSVRRLSARSNVPPLPDWTNVERTQSPLDPHPQSLRKMFLRSDVQGWHAAVPEDWVDVIASDASKMKQCQPGKDHFSDVYISGMPAKRRKIMLGKSCASVKSPDDLLTDCLSDAIRGCPLGSTEQTSVLSAFSNSTVQAEATSNRANVENASELVRALREFMSDRISDRLRSDPDFDPTRFPMCDRAFGPKKRS